MVSSVKAPGEPPPEPFLYRREALKSADEVLSEARKNHSIFKSNVVSGGLRPSIRHVGLSRFQFGDGEYAASVESMQRLLVEKTARPEPLPEMQEPVQLTRTLSRSCSSRLNPFRSPGTKPRLQLDTANQVAAAKTECDGDSSSIQAQIGNKTDAGLTEAAVEAAARGADASGGPYVGLATAYDTDQQRAVAAVALPLRCSSMTSATAASSRRSTSHSFKSLTCSSLAVPRAVQFSPVSSGGGGGTINEAIWSGYDGGNSDGEGDADGGSCSDRQRSFTEPVNAFAHDASATAHHVPNNIGAHHSGDDSDLDSGDLDSGAGGVVSSFSLFTRCNSNHSMASPVNYSLESPTGRVDQLLKDLRRFKGAGPAAAAASGSGGGSAVVAAREPTAVPQRGGGRSARVSFSGTSRFESAREQFCKNRSATTAQLPDGDGALAGGAPAASGVEVAERSILYSHQNSRHHHQQQQQQRASFSQIPLQHPLQLLSAGSAPSSGLTSPLTSRPATAASARRPVSRLASTETLLAPGAQLLASPGATGSLAAAAAAQSGGGASSSQWSHRRPVGEDDRPALRPHNTLSSSPGGAAAVAASNANSTRTSHLAAGGAGTAAGGAGAAAVGAAPASPGRLGTGAGRGGGRKWFGEAAAPTSTAPSRAVAPSSPLDGWSSRGASRPDGSGRINSSVGSFFNSLLSVGGGQPRPNGPASLA